MKLDGWYFAYFYFKRENNVNSFNMEIISKKKILCKVYLELWPNKENILQKHFQITSFIGIYI